MAKDRASPAPLAAPFVFGFAQPIKAYRLGAEREAAIAARGL